MGNGGKTILFSLLLLSLEATFVASTCSSSGPRIQCGEKGSNENRGLCLKNKMCCYQSGTKPNCFVNMGMNVQNDLLKAKNLLGKPPSQQVSTQTLAMAARRLNVSESEKRNFEGRAGSFSMSPMDTMSAAVFGFPTCPLKVPVCQRLRCQPYNPASERNPMECYKDPRCCFDAALFVHKYTFGDSYMGGAPVCFLGPTSPRFLEIAQSIQPWSPFYLGPVVRIFERYFDLNIDFNKATQCLSSNLLDIDIFRSPKCGWEGISKLECNLKGCCYNSKTGNCAYPRHLFGGSPFGGGASSTPSYEDRKQFPELFQTATTTCTQYGLGADPTEVFRRLPCSQSSSTGITGYASLYRTCPSSCCKNMMALFPGFNDLSRSGSPSKIAFIQSQYSSFSSNAIMNQAFISLFCPYFYVKIAPLGDLTESVRGCCKQTSCYHKSLACDHQHVNNPYCSQGSSAPIIPISIVGGNWGSWSAWSSCPAHCGARGQQSRQRFCMINGQVRDNSMCVGGDSQEHMQCIGHCPVQAYSWGQWGAYGSCSGQCGRSGTQTRRRTCRNRSGHHSPNRCHGNGVESTSCISPPCLCQWSQWAPSGSCSITCYHQRHASQGAQVYRRQCQGSGHQSCTDRCPGANYKTVSCSAPPCSSYQLGQWGPWSRCDSACKQQRRKKCYNNGTPVDPAHCSAPSEEKSCDFGLCRPSQPWVTWSSWSEWTDCTSNVGSKTRWRRCLYKGNAGHSIGDDLCTFVYKTNPTETITCYGGSSIHSNTGGSVTNTNSGGSITHTHTNTGGSITHTNTGGSSTNTNTGGSSSHTSTGGSSTQTGYGWTNWSAWSRCSGRCISGTQTRTRSCVNRVTLRQALSSRYCGYEKMSESKTCFNALSCFGGFGSLGF